MKKLLSVFFIIGLICSFPSVLFAASKSITVGSVTDGGLIYKDGFKEFFEKGTYVFSVYDGAWLAWKAVDLDMDKGWIWKVNIYQPSLNKHYILGSSHPRFATAKKALTANLGQSIIIEQPSDGYIWFWHDDNKVRDNTGAVTLRVDLMIP